MSEQDNEVTKVVEDLVIAMLSVDSWTLEKSFALRDALQREEIFELDTLAEVRRPKSSRGLNGLAIRGATS